MTPNNYISRELGNDDACVSHSGFSNIDNTNNPQKYVNTLNDTGTTDFWKEIKKAMLLRLALKVGESALDIGCGTGDDVRVLEKVVGPLGRAIGIDRSITMISEAKERSRQQKMSGEFFVQDTAHLGFSSESFDGCRIERVLQHIDDPRTALTEVARIMRPGGRVVAAEPDYGSMIIQGADESITQEIINCRISHFKSGRVGLQLPLLFRQTGLTDILIEITTAVNCDRQTEASDYLLSKLASSAVKQGVISSSQASSWLDQLQEAGEKQHFLVSILVFTVSAKKPI